MKILAAIITLSLFFASDIDLAMPHTHEVEAPQKIGQMSKKQLQFPVNLI